MPLSKINGVNINWRAIGERGPWVVMTTGGRRGHDEFIPLAQKIAKNGYRVMLHDRRNTGASDLRIEAPGASGAAPYVQRLTRDGRRIARTYLTSCELRAGGTLRFTLGSSADTAWAASPEAAPPSASHPRADVDGCAAAPS